MKKFLPFLTVALLLPQLVSAVWWNPFSWGHSVPAQQVVVPSPKAASVSATTTRKVAPSIQATTKPQVIKPASVHANVRPATQVREVVTPVSQPIAAPAVQNYSNDNYYTNVDGNRVHSPVYSSSVPAGATAQCRDGTYSFSQHRSGTCSGHGGVAEWL